MSCPLLISTVVWATVAQLLEPLEVAWPELLAQVDLAYWRSMRGKGLVRAMPGRVTLARRWHWKEHRVGRFLKATASKATLTGGGDPPMPLQGSDGMLPGVSRELQGLLGGPGPWPALLAGLMPVAANTVKPENGGSRGDVASTAAWAGARSASDEPPPSTGSGPGLQTSGPGEPGGGDFDIVGGSPSGVSSIGSGSRLGISGTAGAHRALTGNAPEFRQPDAGVHWNFPSAPTSPATPAHQSGNRPSPAAHTVVYNKERPSSPVQAHQPATHCHNDGFFAPSISHADAPPAPCAGTVPAISSSSSSDLSSVLDPVRDQKKEKKDENRPLGENDRAHPVLQRFAKLLERWSGAEAPLRRRWAVDLAQDLAWFRAEVLASKEALALDLLAVLKDWDAWLEGTARAPTADERRLFPRKWKKALLGQIQRQATWLTARKGSTSHGDEFAQRPGIQTYSVATAQSDWTGGTAGDGAGGWAAGPARDGRDAPADTVGAPVAPPRPQPRVIGGSGGAAGGGLAERAHVLKSYAVMAANIRVNGKPRAAGAPGAPLPDLPGARADSGHAPLAGTGLL